MAYLGYKVLLYDKIWSKYYELSPDRNMLMNICHYTLAKPNEACAGN